MFLSLFFANYLLNPINFILDELCNYFFSLNYVYLNVFCVENPIFYNYQKLERKFIDGS